MQYNSDILVSGTYPTPGKDSVTDKVLWRNFKTGNDLAMSILYKKHVQGLYEYGMLAHPNHETILKCLHELFANLWKNREGLPSINEIRPYLFKYFRTILIHQLNTNHTNKKYRHLNQDFEFTHLLAMRQTDQPTTMETVEFRNWITSLNKEQREVIYLRFKKEFTNQQIAEITPLRVDEVDIVTSKTIRLHGKKLVSDQSLAVLK